MNILDTFTFFQQIKFNNCSSNLVMANMYAQYKHEPEVKAVRVNGQNH